MVGKPGFVAEWRGNERLAYLLHQKPMGRFEFEIAARPSGLYGPYNANVIMIPFAVLFTGLIPLAAGAIWRFRFPLWSWFFFMAVVAAELAFYAQFARSSF
ncbi:hypothetical protein [Anatilimnocola floriformis]|uniref:hypothetical protein n=1 Tax=Anatilimnocola floriformis TaxID=2948575 RepID=UPI0020C3AFF8|nr:hypothetical protein [Anatilimnocola floriformis]